MTTEPADGIGYPNRAPLQHCLRNETHPAHQHDLDGRAHYCPGTTPYGPYNPIWARLSDIGQLRDGWLDGSGMAVAGGIILQAGRIAEALPKSLHPLSIFPTEPGGIEIEWRDRNGAHSITINADGTLFLLSDDPPEAADSTSCCWPSCLTAVQQVELAAQVSAAERGEALPPMPYQRQVCGCETKAG